MTPDRIRAYSNWSPDMSAMAPPPPPKDNFEVELPAGGVMFLQSPEEVDLWQNSAERYVEDYQLNKTNDLILLGAILQQQIILFRAQRKLNGMDPEVDANNVPTGRYKLVQIESDEVQGQTKILNTATSEIRAIEKALGIDKVTREQGGAVTVGSYIRTLKKAAHERGIHISERLVKYDAFVNQLRTMLRMFHNLDAEDRAYHNLTETGILSWASDELAKLEQADKDFAHHFGKLYAGKL